MKNKTNKIIIKNESQKPLLLAVSCVERVIAQGKLSRNEYGNSFLHASQFVEEKLVVYAELRKSGTVKFRVCDR